MQIAQDSHTLAKRATDDLLVDEGRIAELLGCSRRVVMQMRQASAGPPWIRIGTRRGQIRYPLAAFHAWIASRMQTSASERAA